MTTSPDELVKVLDELDRFLEAAAHLPARQRAAAVHRLARGLRSALAVARPDNPPPATRPTTTERNH